MDYDKRRLMNYISDQKYFQETSFISVKRLSKRRKKAKDLSHHILQIFEYVD